MPNAAPLPNTLGDTVLRCQSLLGDPTGQWVKPGYITPFINQAYSEMAKMIKNASGKNFEAIIELLNVPSGTTSLYPYQSYAFVDPANPAGQKTRGPLAGLFDPIRMWVKSAGQLPQYYTRAKGPRETLPHINPPGITPGNYAVVVTFAWIGNKLVITPVNGAIDIQVYGRFNPPRLVSMDDELLLYGDMTDTLAAATIAWTGIERTNTTILTGAESRAVAGIDNIVADLIRQTQKVPRRLAQMGGSQGCGGSSLGWY